MQPVPTHCCFPVFLQSFMHVWIQVPLVGDGWICLHYHYWQWKSNVFSLLIVVRFIFLFWQTITIFQTIILILWCILVIIVWCLPMQKLNFTKFLLNIMGSYSASKLPHKIYNSQGVRVAFNVSIRSSLILRNSNGIGPTCSTFLHDLPPCWIFIAVSTVCISFLKDRDQNCSELPRYSLTRKLNQNFPTFILHILYNQCQFAFLITHSTCMSALCVPCMIAVIICFFIVSSKVDIL